MKLKTSLQAEVQEEGTYFPLLRMTMLDEGLEIQAQSPLFARWIQSISSGGEEVIRLTKKHPWYLGSTLFYRRLLNLDSFPPRGINAFIYPEEHDYFSDGQVNLLWLLHPNLAEGFSLVVKQPISLNNFEDYFAKCCDAIRDIYVTQLRKASLEATFSEIWVTP